MKNSLLILIAVLLFQISAAAQYEKIADESIAYVKASTFGKPDVIKKTTKMALSQVRVHYKIVTTRAAETRDNGAKVTVYLDGAMTNDDLQQLTNEFYAMLQKKLGALGIEFAPWDAIAQTEYYNDREEATLEKNNVQSDGGNGQAWVSFTAHNGPVFYRYDLVRGYGELLAYGKMKKINKMTEALGADFATFDVVVDFTAIDLATSKDTVWEDGAKYLKYGANMNVAAMMSVPQSYALFIDQKNGFDQYASKLPVGRRDFFSGKPYSDESKAAYKTRTIFGDTKFTFTPVVIDARRELYVQAARRALELYADIFAEKMRLIRGGVKPGKEQIADTRGDGKTLKQVAEAAKQNNDTTAVTYNELMAAGREAEAKNNVRLAIEYYTKASAGRPDEAEPYAARLIANEKLKNWDAMVKDGEALLKINPNNLLAKYALGTALFFKEDYKKAAKVLAEVVAAKPDFLQAVQNYSLALAGTKKYDEALAVLNNAIRQTPDYAGFYRARGVIFKIQGNAQLAQADEIRAAQLERGQ
ncbi:MAG TPA: tetratricopeptide repeat protein [Pyrinomonadaceae bacterium]|jgi:Flp pilus assembly protein TadD